MARPWRSRSRRILFNLVARTAIKGFSLSAGGLAKDGHGCVQAGAGIVADSGAEMEHRESLNNAQALIRAVRQAPEL
jgi:anthranilate/para-aminobenzoate synthase component I